VPTYFTSSIVNVLKITDMETAKVFVIRPMSIILKLVGILKKTLHGIDRSI
jgi:hypothetical protein